MFCLILISAYTHLFILCVICIIGSVNEQYVGFCVHPWVKNSSLCFLMLSSKPVILGLDQNPLATYQELQHLICRTSQLHSTPFACLQSLCQTDICQQFALSWKLYQTPYWVLSRHSFGKSGPVGFVGSTALPSSFLLDVFLLGVMSISVCIV